MVAYFYMTGFLLIDKPDGPTSHDVVNTVRRATGEKRVGHAGTLDPFATGLLLVGVGREATREFPKLVGLDKEYEAVFALGATSDTDDRTGRVVATENTQNPTDEDIQRAMQTLVGEIEQLPPNYSAIKVGGRKAYDAARKGETLELKPRRVTVHSFELLKPITHTPSPTLHVRIHCSTGTYIRALARDLGAKLGTGGYVQELRRTTIGSWKIEEATVLSALNKESVQGRLVPVETFLSRLAR